MTLPTIAGFDPNRQMEGYVYDEALAKRACDFFPDCLVHVKNSRFKKAGDAFELEPWQETIVSLLFGVIHEETRLRRFRTGYVEIPRKNGKTTLAAGIALKGLFADHEEGAECYCAASTRDQSSLMFDIAEKMTKKSPTLHKAAKIKSSVKRIVYGDSYLRAVASDAHSLHGQNGHVILADEIHAWLLGGYDLWDVLETGTASRAQPIMLGITTAGFDQATKCYELHKYSEGVRDGTIDDPTFLPIIFGAGPGDDWQDPKVWAAANPNLGKSIPIEYLTQQCLKAQNNASFENSFRRLHLNQWTSQRTRWLSMEAWEACENESSEEPD